MAAEEGEKFETLVLSGGAVRAIAFVGAMRYLEETGRVTSVQTVVGSSAGAIVAFMLALGYRADEMHEWVTDRMARSGVNQLDMDGVLDMVEMMGVDSGERLEGYLASMLEEKTGKRDATFAELQQHMTDVRLVVCASDLTRGRPEYFSARSRPDVSVVTAIRASCCIPLLFVPVVIGDSMYVDGGIFDNLPTGFAASESPGTNDQSYTGGQSGQILALNVKWDMPSGLPRDVVQYSYYLVVAMMRRTNAVHDRTRREERGLVVVDMPEMPVLSASDHGILGFCLDTMEFNVEADVVAAHEESGYAIIRQRLDGGAL